MYHMVFQMKPLMKIVVKKKYICFVFNLELPVCVLKYDKLLGCCKLNINNDNKAKY